MSAAAPPIGHVADTPEHLVVVASSLGYEADPGSSGSPIYNRSSRFVVFKDAHGGTDINRIARLYGEGITMNGFTRKVMTAAAAAVMLGSAAAAMAFARSTTNSANMARTATTASITRTAANSVPRCYTQDLSADLRGAESGPGNEVGFILTLTNEGQRSCSLDGYPGLGLQDSSHHTLPSHTFWGSTFFDRDPGRQLIVLSPGETVSSSLAFISGATEHAVDAYYLIVTPPNAYEHLVIGPFSRAMAVPIYRGNLYVTAMARHTPHP